MLAVSVLQTGYWKRSLPRAIWLYTPFLLFSSFHFQGFIYLEEKHYNIEKVLPDVFVCSFLYKRQELAFSPSSLLTPYFWAELKPFYEIF